MSEYNRAKMPDSSEQSVGGGLDFPADGERISRPAPTLDSISAHGAGIRLSCYKTPELADRVWTDKLYRCSGYRGCEYSFASLFIWCGAFNQKLALIDGYMSVRMETENGFNYLFPAGCGDMEPVIRELSRQAEANNDTLRLVGVTKQSIEMLETLFPGCFEYNGRRYSFDYLYTVDRLADLAGKKLHAKRNHINKFVSEHPDWQFKLIRPDTIDECVKIYETWLERADNDDKPFGVDLEISAMQRAFQNFDELGLEGGILYAEGRPVAFTIGERINNDTFAVHFEKAYGDIQGAYTMINREFARYVRARYADVVYINREEDMGVPGLRKSKLSYCPDLLLEKYCAKLVKKI